MQAPVTRTLSLGFTRPGRISVIIQPPLSGLLSKWTRRSPAAKTLFEVPVPGNAFEVHVISGCWVEVVTGVRSIQGAGASFGIGATALLVA